MKICLSNLVYGERYTKVFLDYHLKTLVDDSNLSAFANGSEYIVFTDGANIEQIKSNVYFKRLVDAMPVKFLIFSAPSGNAYDWRYKIQSFQAGNSAQYALDRGMMLSILCADTVFGKGFWNRINKLISLGHDGVLIHAMRSGYEGITIGLDALGGAPTADQLFELAFMNQHPLWMSMNWDAPFFAKMPYHLLWNDSQTLVVRGFSIGVAVHFPTPEIVSVGGNSDIYVPPLLKNPYFADDWSELPWAGAEFLSCWFPSYHQYRASTLRVAHWAKQAILPQNILNLRRVAYFKKQSTPVPHNLIHSSAHIAEEIISLVGLMSSPK
jgi:hypothetical protein